MYVFSVNAETGWHGSGAFAAAVLTLQRHLGKFRAAGLLTRRA